MSIAELVPIYTEGPVAFSKREAVSAIVGARMARSIATGKGNKAAKREALAMMPREELTEQDVDRLAEQHSEGRTYNRAFAPNFKG